MKNEIAKKRIMNLFNSIEYKTKKPLCFTHPDLEDKAWKILDEKQANRYLYIINQLALILEQV